MSNDFRNRDEVDRRRSRTIAGGSGGTDSTLKELILLPNFDTFIFAPPPAGACGADRWTSINTTFTTPNNSIFLPIGLVNPWNDGAAGGPNTTTQAVRTPTRTIIGFDLTALPANANILSADLQMTVAGSSYWIQPSFFAPVDPNQGQGDVNANFIAGNNIMDNVWVAYNFDGGVGNTGSAVRAFAYPFMSMPTFTWYDFVQTGVGGAWERWNEAIGTPGAPGWNNSGDPWSLKRWYVWGQRNFELHMPFGRPSIGASGPEKLAYQADAYLCAKNGMPGICAAQVYVTLDFVRIWKGLITGQRGDIPQYQWNNMVGFTSGNVFIPGWFNPNDPIKVITYNGSISKAGETTENQYPRWNALFLANYDAALQRLKDSVQPLIDCGMQIGIDALSVAPGPIPGDYIPFEELNFEAQRGWWEPA